MAFFMSRLGGAALLFVFAQLCLAEPMVIRRGAAAEPPSLDPTTAAGTLAAPIIWDLFSGLLDRDGQGELAPACAESWTVSEDGRIYTFRLREGLKWSDGQPLTAEDFVYSYRRLMDPATASRLAGVFYPLLNGQAVLTGEMPPESLGVSAPDPRTLVIELEQRTPYFLALIGNLRVAPVPRHVIERLGASWARADSMVSNGAFTLAERIPQSYIRLDKNPLFYAADEVRADQVIWYPTQNLATSLKRFRAGELDMVLNFPPTDIDWIRKNMPETLHITANLGVYFLVINTSRPPFDDPRVRQALSIAIDREAITDRLLRTGVQPAYGYVTPAITDYEGVDMPDRALSFPERQAKARRLLAEAGYGPENPLTVDVAYDTNEENRKIMVAIAAMWQAIGARARLTDVEFGLLNRKVRTGDYSVARWFYIASYDDPHALLQVLESGNPNNWPRWENAEFDSLLQASNLETDPVARLELLADAERVMLDEHPIIPISFYVGRRLVSPRLKGWFDSPRGPPQSRYLWIE